ncbi:POU domain, class 4, transcription factor 3-like [Trichomycterus rosablanca]|uniref:POU domain, class 4, transcription factor 3-like n=1 Tax=Trichomycterus rosablanca TaxID=2290929 RepID=UPI002F357664
MMTMNSKQQHFPMHASSEMRRVCLPAPQLQANLFGAFDESLLAVADLTKPHSTQYHAMSTGACATSASSAPISTSASHHHHNLSQALEGELLEHLSSALAMGGMAQDPSILPSQANQHHLQAWCHLHQAATHPHSHPHAHPHPHAHLQNLPGGDTDSDPRELEAFAERFKQRRIKLGVTQADVGSALANLKIPGVGSLSQSTICRFESLTLSHNNMIALRPVLQTWLDEAEAAHRDTSARADMLLNGNGESKRKRTSIAAPEKRSLEAYFAIQPRPSSEKIAAIAEKLDLKKNVVRVWFCNQRQKQKRMKYSAAH